VKPAAVRSRLAVPPRPPLPAFAACLFACLAVCLAACGPGDVPNLDSPGSAIVCFGDSITAGVGAGADEAYPSRLAELLGLPVVNAGVSGDTAADGVARLDRVLAADPWLVIVELGGNDLLRRRPAEATEQDLEIIVDRLLTAGTAVVLVPVEAPLIGGSYGDMFERLARRYGVPSVDGVLRDVLTDPRRKSDQIHPNAAGYADLAAEVARVVEPLVKERRRLGLPVAPREAA
jgi:lysophospholipase L1-like esterase